MNNDCKNDGGRTIEPGKYKVIEGSDLEAIEHGLDSYRDMDVTDPIVVHRPFSGSISE